MTHEINFKEHVRSFNASMLGTQRILYVGTGCDIGKYPALAGKPWRCIYTTNPSAGFADAFSRPNRQVRVVRTRAEYDLARTKLDRGNPLLVCLNGFDPQDADLDDIEQEVERAVNREALQSTLETLLKSELMVELVVIGYDPDSRDEISPLELYKLLRLLSDNRVTFYGVSEGTGNNRYLKKLEELGIVTIFQENLGEALEELAAGEGRPDSEEPDSQSVSSEAEEQSHTVYINEIPTVLTQSLCHDFNQYGRVLSVREMMTGTISRNMQVDYFYRFLKRSPYDPQWYGYTRRNQFAVSREYEAELYDTVISGLASSSEDPVALLGPTSSGKSIALAALAFRIFQERKYPILFVNNQDVSFAANSPAANSLDNLLKEIRDKGGRALVILDWSIYNLQRSNIVRELSDRCNNRGHRVLFVTSALNPELNQKNRQYKTVQAANALTPEERQRFKALVVDKGKLPQDKVERWMQKNQNVTGLLSMLYRLVYELHPQLEQGVKQEITKALADTKEEILSLEDPVMVQKPLGAIAAQLVELGLAEDPNSAGAEDPQELKQGIIDSLQSFSESVAAASLFKLRMPLTMAMSLLQIPECTNRQKYRNVVFSAPWLHCAMDDDKYAPGEYYVEFRDPTDALIYLRGIDKSGPETMKIVANVIRTLQKDSFYSDSIRFLERLIRMIGPNSDDPSVYSDWYNTYGGSCREVISALAWLRAQEIIEPRLIAQEITYIREYYGNKYQPSPETRIQGLYHAISIAREALEKASRPNTDITDWLQGLIDSIMVESIFSELRLEEALAEAGIQSLPADMPLALYSFSQRSEKLREVIQSQPESNYPYTALLSCFISKYENSAVDMEMLRDMSGVLEVVDVTAVSIPSVEDNPHYQTKKSILLNIVDRACNGRRASRYFDELLEMGSPVGIYLRARAMLRKAQIDYKEELRKGARKTCGEILRLLEDPKYAAIVSTHAPCQYMRLNLTWLYYNKRPLFQHERQLTRVPTCGWEKLYQICDEFRANIIERQPECTYRSTVYYLMALSCAQLNNYGKAIDLWREVHEDDFHSLGRQYTWHILCDENGTPKPFTGTFNRRLTERRIYIKEMECPVLYPSLQSINKSDTAGEAANLCIGTSFRGFSAFSKTWKPLRY